MHPLRFDNRFVTELPGDKVEGNHPRQVEGACWSHASPTPVAAPRLIAHAHEVAEMVGFTDADVSAPEFAEVFGGNAIYDGMVPYAACYGGHQFGHWARQLGDGRAMTLGETVNARGERWELQLKGAGRTAYSRTADGRAVLRSSVREFLCSEAMFHLGVPTTRALSLVATGDVVVRDMFYDGRPEREPGAIVCRVAPSFVRFGNFELPSARGDHELLKQLTAFTLGRDYPEIARSEGSFEQHVERMFHEVCVRTAHMVNHWMRVGFVHGVMNTDNMSILGLTIDYGPYGFIDNFDPTWTPNTTDAQHRRYRFGQQGDVALWNLACLAQALSPLLPNAESLKASLQHYEALYADLNRKMLASKFGITWQGDDDASLISDGLGLLQRAEVDMTLFFRGLANVNLSAATLAPLEEAFYRDDLRQTHDAELQAWLARYAQRAQQEAGTEAATADERRAWMNAVNPRYILRNYIAQEAIDLATAGDDSRIHTLLDVLRRPYDEQPAHAQFAKKRPEWARDRAGCSMLSCSS